MLLRVSTASIVPVYNPSCGLLSKAANSTPTNCNSIIKLIAKLLYVSVQIENCSIDTCTVIVGRSTTIVNTQLQCAVYLFQARMNIHITFILCMLICSSIVSPVPFIHYFIFPRFAMNTTNNHPLFFYPLISGIKATKLHLISVHHISNFSDLKSSPFLNVGSSIRVAPPQLNCLRGSNSNKGKMNQTWSILIWAYPQIADYEQVGSACGHGTKITY